MSMTTHPYSPALTLDVFWHRQFANGETYGQELYAFYSREIQQGAIYRLPGIPLFWHTTPPTFASGLDGLRAIVCLVDANLVIDKAWTTQLIRLWEQCSATEGIRFFPVAVEPSALQIDGVSQVNFIRVDSLKTEQEKTTKLISELSQELCRFLVGRQRLSEDGTQLSDAPITLFLSHSKTDGIDFTSQLKTYIDQHTHLKSFFDTSDIAAGHSFKREIHGHIEDSALLVVQTDSYASRAWCRKEVIAAKRARKPVVVVNVVSKGETRSFPYMGNVPTIRWDGAGTNILGIIDVAVAEVLRHLFAEKQLTKLAQIYDFKNAIVLPHSPELLSLVDVDRSRTDNIVVYPDPPLGYEESQLLQSLAPDIKFVTPTLLPTAHYATPREPVGTTPVTIGLSISESPDARLHGLGVTHLNDALAEFTRYLLVMNTNVAYGGDLRKGGFTEILFELVRSYFPDDVQPRHKIRNYLFWPASLTVTPTQRAEQNRVADFRDVSPPDDVRVDPRTFLEPDCAANKFVWSRCLTEMRRVMNAEIDARVLLGGQVTGYKGKMPGLLEEAVMAIETGKPLYLIGGFGGCTEAIIDALRGGPTIALTELYHVEHNPGYQEVLALYQRAGIMDSAPDYNAIRQMLATRGVDTLQNGLSTFENERLFETRHIPEMIALVLKGLVSVGLVAIP